MKMKIYMDVQHIAVNKIYDNCHAGVILKVLKVVSFGVYPLLFTLGHADLLCENWNSFGT